MLLAPTKLAIDLPMERIAEFCRKHQVAEFALFGSVLRDDFRPDSDLDVMITFAPEARPSLWTIGGMKLELEQYFGRPVDLVERRGIEQSPNWIRREEILRTTRVIYAR
jgi:uncharacterized protein